MKKALIILGLLVSFTMNLQAQTDEIDRLVEKAFAAQDRGDYQSALQAFDKAISLGGSSDIKDLRNSCIGEIVGEYRNRYDYDGAKAYVDNFIAREPDNYYLYVKKAELLADQGDLGTAIGLYKKASELSPNSYEIYLSLGMSLYFEGDNQKSKGNSSKAKALYQNALGVFENTANVLRSQGFTPEAFDNMNELIQDYINKIKGKLGQME